MESPFKGCNRTELVQVCRDIGLRVEPGTTEEDIFKMLEGELVVTDVGKSNVDTWRDAIMAFLLDNWQVVRAQLDCPAKSGEPNACYGCIDAQVIACVVDNQRSEKLIQLKRKKPEPTVMQATVQKPSITSAPRSAEELGKLGIFGLKSLASELHTLGHYPEWTDKAVQTAFTQLPIDKKAELIAAKIAGYDGTHGVPAAPQQMSLPAQPVSAPPPQAVAPPQPAPAPQGPPKRDPTKFTGAPGMKAAAGIAAPAPATQASPGSSTHVDMEKVQQQLALILEIVQGFTHRVTGLETSVNAIRSVSENRFSELDRAVATTVQLNNVILGMLGNFAENALAVAVEEQAPAIEGTSQRILSALDQLGKG